MLVNAIRRGFGVQTQQYVGRNFAVRGFGTTRGFSTQTSTTAARNFATSTAEETARPRPAAPTAAENITNVFLALFRFSFTHPVPIIFGGLAVYRISITMDEDDERNGKKGNNNIKKLRSARLEGLKEYNEAYYKKSEVDVQGFSKTLDPKFYARKGMKPGSTDVLSSENSVAKKASAA